MSASNSFDAYSAIARVYDRLNAEVDYVSWAEFIQKCFQKYADTPPSLVLDLACGTGTISCLMAEKGYRVLACDASIEMLSAAMMKSAGMENAPMFLHQSMEKLRLASEVDAVISTIDAINYLIRY